MKTENTPSMRINEIGKIELWAGLEDAIRNGDVRPIGHGQLMNWTPYFYNANLDALCFLKDEIRWYVFGKRIDKNSILVANVANQAMHYLRVHQKGV